MNIGVQVSVQVPAFCCLSPCGTRISSEASFIPFSEELLFIHQDPFQKFLSWSNQAEVAMPSFALPHSHILCSLILPLLNSNHLCHCLLDLLNYMYRSKKGAYFIHSSPQDSMPSPWLELHKYWRTNISRTASVFCRPSLCEDSKNISHHWLLLSICASKRDLTNTEIWPQK